MFVIAYITDIHWPDMPRLRPDERSIKRILGYLSWHRNRKHKHSLDVLKILKADLTVQAPDHIAIGGDQTNLALDGEYMAVKEWVKALGKPSQDVSMVLGNHDAYRPDFENSFWKYWGEYAQGDDAAGRDFPFVRKRGNVALIAVNSAIRTPPFAAWGKVGADQLEKLRRILKDLGEQEFCRIVMIHHPPQKNGAIYRKRLIDAAAFRAVIKDAGAELVLHGHNHKSIKAMIEGPSDAICVRGAGSASSNGKGMKPAHYPLIAIEENKNSWRITINHRQFDPSRRVFATIDEDILDLPKTGASG